MSFSIFILLNMLKKKQFLILLICITSTIGQSTRAQTNRLINTSDDFIKVVNFTVNERMVYLLDVTINGMKVQGKFLLDNGCRESFISESLAKEMHLKKLKSKNVLDAYGEKKKLEFSKLNYSISGIRFNKIKTSILTDESFYNSGCDIRGIIGRNLMKKCIWRISIDDEILISNKIELLNTKAYKKQKLILGTGIDIGFMDGDSAIASIIDLGSQSFVTLTPNTLSEISTGNRVENKISTNKLEWATIFYKDNPRDTSVIFDTDAALVSGLYISGDDNVIRNPIIDIDSKDDSYIPLIGSELLAYYDIILDGINEAFYYRNKMKEYKQRDLLGLGFVIDNSEVYINYLVANSPAEKSGLVLGDQIIEINHKKASDILKNNPTCNYRVLIKEELLSKPQTIIKIAREDKMLSMKKAYLFPNGQ